MSKGFNQVIAKGGLVRDPDLRYTQSRTAFLGFTLACTESVKKDGEWTDVPEYVPCKAWGGYAETIAKHCVKGSQLFIRGKFKTDKYEGKDGKMRWDSYVLVQDVQFCGGKRKDDSADRGVPSEPDIPPEDFSDVPF